MSTIITKPPNFVVIGAPKAGTTSLYHYLKQHPDVYLPDRKELHFFSYDILKNIANGPGDKYVLKSLCKNIEEYNKHYETCGSEKAIGEVSPSYLYFHQSAQKMKLLLGDIKIIVLLRNPVEKAFSQYMHLVSEARETEEFETALSLEQMRKESGWSDFWRYIESSKYSEGLKAFYEVFGEQNVKVIITEEFLKNTGAYMADIYKFINVDDKFKCNTSIMFNRSGAPKSKLIAKIFVRPNILLSTAKKFIPSSIGEPIRRFITSRNAGVKEDMGDDVRSKLLQEFEGDIHEVEKITGISTGWLRSAEKSK